MVLRKSWKKRKKNNDIYESGIIYREAVVVSVKNLSGFVSVNADGSWNFTGGSKYKTEVYPDPVS